MQAPHQHCTRANTATGPPTSASKSPSNMSYVSTSHLTSSAITPQCVFISTFDSTTSPEPLRCQPLCYSSARPSSGSQLPQRQFASVLEQNLSFSWITIPQLFQNPLPASNCSPPAPPLRVVETVPPLRVILTTYYHLPAHHRFIKISIPCFRAIQYIHHFAVVRVC